MAGWLDGSMAGCVGGWMAGWLGGWMTDWWLVARVVELEDALSLVLLGPPASVEAGGSQLFIIELGVAHSLFLLWPLASG